MMIFPINVNEPVIPADKPVVPKAETTSNKICKNGCLSVIFKIKTATIINTILDIVTARALITVLAPIERFNKLISVLPFKKARTEKMITIAVDNLIPPPVEALPAPMNMRREMKNNDESSMAPMSIELNPAVRGDTA